MARGDLLARTEEVILTAVAVTGVEGQAYGMNIFEECCRLTRGRYVSIGSIYTILDRLQKKGFVESWIEENSDPARHDRKRCFRITEAGVGAVRETAELSRSIRLAWRTIPLSLGLSSARRLRARRRLADSELKSQTPRAS